MRYLVNSPLMAAIGAATLAYTGAGFWVVVAWIVVWALYWQICSRGSSWTRSLRGQNQPHLAHVGSAWHCLGNAEKYEREVGQEKAKPLLTVSTTPEEIDSKLRKHRPALASTDANWSL